MQVSLRIGGNDTSKKLLKIICILIGIVLVIAFGNYILDIAISWLGKSGINSRTLTLGSLITAGEFLVIMFFRNSISEIMGIEERYLGIMFAYLFFVQGYYVFITIERAHYRYKTFSILTGVGIISSCMLSVFLIMVLENKLNARVYGQYLPYILLGIILYILVARKGKQVQFAYYKYSLLLSLPMIPHLLSMTVLSSSDRIMIAKLCGSEYVALYSISADYIVHESLPEYSMALHIYINNESRKIEKATFSIFRIIENEKGEINVCPISQLEKSKLTDEIYKNVTIIYNRITGQSKSNIEILEEYPL